MEKPQRLCIFCQGLGLSKEHIWSEWTRDLIGQSAASGHRNITKFAANGRVHQRRTNGGLDTAKLRVVCKTCNNGWMSGLDSNVKVFGSALLTGTSTSLDATDQIALSRWLIMKMMVTEHAIAREVPVVSTQNDRARIREGKWPLDHQWRIWIAMQPLGPTSRRFVRHRLSINTQFFIFRIGRLIVISTCNQKGINFELLSSYAVQLLPSTEQTIQWPLIGTLADSTITSFESDAKTFLGK
jgi:hypothetical protein